MIQIVNKEECCGCEVCVNICPHGCIRMKQDENGFLYPQIDMERCTDCCLCEKVCPVAKPLRSDYGPSMYAVQNRDEKIRRESTSGGAFSLIADWVLDRDGVVIGAAFDSGFRVIHCAEDQRKQISRFRGSKYVQSHTGYIYKETRKYLRDGKWVCFSGTPCQINGLKKFLDKEYEKLIAVDLACRGVTSPLFLEKYLHYLKEKEGAEITDVSFREKYYGYGFSTMKVGFSNGACVRSGMETNIFLRSFFLGLNVRESCNACRFKTVERVSDFTLFDGWHAGRFSGDMDDDKGTTICIVQSEKGMKVFNDIRRNCRYAEMPLEQVVKLDGRMLVNPVKASPKREEFFRDIHTMSIPEIQQKYYPITLKRKVLSAIKPAVYKAGIFKYYMKMKEKTGRR